MNAAELLVKCLENEGVEYIFGIPGEENIDLMDALLASPIRFVTTHHEQGAAFMADVYGRLTGRAGVCMATLGPGATNLITGVADANMDHAPIVAIAGQGATTRLHKESHQILDLVNLFRPITKYAAQILEPEIVPEIVRKAFKVAQTDKPGGAFIDFPENIAAMDVTGAPIKVQTPASPVAPRQKLEQAAELISRAKMPVILAGNGVIRMHAESALRNFAETLHIVVANTFMAKGVLPFSHPLALGAIGLNSPDLPWFAFERADLIICVGFDMVEYPPERWNPGAGKTLVHISALPAEVDAHYVVECGVPGDIATSLDAIAALATPRTGAPFAAIREAILADRAEHASDTGFPIKPQRVVWELSEALDPDDVVVCDVGAHKMWMSRNFRAERPNTCIISNGFAAMGIAVPGALAAKLAFPERKVVAVTGDAGFMMNSQEIETAMRMNAPFVVLIWTDSEYGLIAWHQKRHFSRTSHIEFNNPDFVKYAESFGARGVRVERAEDLLPTLREALAADTVVLIDCAVDYRENMILTERLKAMASPL
ncbi:MAG: acetolactate synthase large subunit [Burkholderiaceae bacterium]|nr:acetolactate synthase large subunit [Burkholderiaceae bacterium]